MVLKNFLRDEDEAFIVHLPDIGPCQVFINR